MKSVSLESKIISPGNRSVWQFYLELCCGLALMSHLSSAEAHMQLLVMTSVMLLSSPNHAAQRVFACVKMHINAGVLQMLLKNFIKYGSSNIL